MSNAPEGQSLQARRADRQVEPALDRARPSASKVRDGAIIGFARRPISAIARQVSWGHLTVPGLVFLLFFFAWPVVSIAVTGFTSPKLGFENFSNILSSSVDNGALIRTLITASVVTGACLLIGYPVAYLMTVTSSAISKTILLVLLASLWLSQVARTFSLEVILNDTGLINKALMWLGLTSQPLPLIRDLFGVTFGMTEILLPTMVLPLWVVMRRIDPDLGRAAAGLGARPSQSFARIFLPLSIPGILTGSLLVFVLAVGFYVTPLILGGGTYITTSQLVYQQVQLLNQAIGSALSVELLVVCLVVLAIAGKVVGLRPLAGLAPEKRQA